MFPTPEVVTPSIRAVTRATMGSDAGTSASVPLKLTFTVRRQNTEMLPLIEPPPVEPAKAG